MSPEEILSYLEQCPTTVGDNAAADLIRTQAAEIASLRAEAERATWQAIETAPKDRPIQLWVKSYPDSEGYIVPKAHWSKFGYFHEVCGPSLKATHWRDVEKGPEAALARLEKGGAK